MDFGVGKKSNEALTAKVSVNTPINEVSKDNHKIQGDETLNSENKLNLEHKLNINQNIKSAKGLKNVVIFGDKGERAEKAEKELKSIAGKTLKAISTSIDPTLGALEHIAKHDILFKLRNIKAAQ